MKSYLSMPVVVQQPVRVGDGLTSCGQPIIQLKDLEVDKARWDQYMKWISKKPKPKPKG